MKNNTRIRPYQEKDRQNVQQTCIVCDNSFSQSRQPILLTLYCDYYIEQEPENCFVLTDADDHAVGYIITSANWQRYKQRYRQYYLPKLKKLSPSFFLFKRLEMTLTGRTMRNYPAHLHIDILPEYQGQGHGTRLLDAATARLKSLSVPGVMLGVGAKNKGAIRFYERYGFMRLRKLFGALLYGYRLDSDAQ